jgi:uncharacterized pyridoxamine 5'-phosphate oxidase family protein
MKTMKSTHTLSPEAHEQRIIDELKAAGITNYGLMKSETKLIPALIHPDEHIGGVVYGQTSQGSIMLVATDQRILYLDAKPFYSTTDMLSYSIVAGVKVNVTGPFASTVLHTRIADYRLRYTNVTCSKKFAQYVDERCIETPDIDGIDNTHNKHQYQKTNLSSSRLHTTPSARFILSPEIKSFLSHHQRGVVSTVDKNNQVHGAVVDYVFDNDHIYYVTKNSTNKARNIEHNQSSSFVIYDESTLQTLQVQAQSSIETLHATKNVIIPKLLQPKRYGSSQNIELPPITKLTGSEILLIKMSPASATLHTYR